MQASTPTHGLLRAGILGSEVPQCLSVERPSRCHMECRGTSAIRLAGWHARSGWGRGYLRRRQPLPAHGALARPWWRGAATAPRAPPVRNRQCVCVTAHRRSSNQHSNSALTLRPDVFNLYCSAVDGWMGKASAGVHGHMGARKRSARTDRAALVIAAQCARPGTLSSSLIPLQDRWTPPPPRPRPPPGQCSLRPEHVRAHSLQPRQR